LRKLSTCRRVVLRFTDAGSRVTSVTRGVAIAAAARSRRIAAATGLRVSAICASSAFGLATVSINAAVSPKSFTK
jgi:hypothetical protein